MAITENGNVSLNKSLLSNRTNLYFAGVLFHEYRHAFQYFSGNYHHWAKEFGYSFVENYQERDAYWFQIKMGAGSFFNGYDRYEDYRSVTKRITYKK